MISPPRAADTQSMLDFVIDQLAAGGEWRTVLEAYVGGDDQRNPVNGDAEGWFPRVKCVEGIEPTQLSQLHGKLIALGYLRFEISGKNGVRYQVSPLGRRVLQRGLRAVAETEEPHE